MSAVHSSSSIRPSRWERLGRPLAIVLLVAAMVTGGATFLAMTGRLPWAQGPRSIFALLVLDLVLLVCFGALITRRLLRLWAERRRDAAGARLHTRLVGLFALVSVLPSFFIALLAVLLFDFGLQSWFSDRVSTAIKESLAVAEAYEQEHRRTINADILAVANGLSRSGRLLTVDPNQFARVLGNQAALRGLTEAVVFQRSGRVIARVGLGSLLDVRPDLPEAALDRAERGSVVVLSGDYGDRLRALIKLDIYVDTYLLVGRVIDPRVVGHMERTSAAVQVYEEIEGERTGLIITFALIFFLVAVLLLLAASWVGLAFADRLSQPIARLVTAAERVGSGDLHVRVHGIDPGDEIGTLGLTFNRMTSDLERQQDELLEANRQIEARRRFIETVLAGVSAGVIGLNEERRVTLVNRSACELLSLEESQLKGRRIGNLSRDLRNLLDTAQRRPGRAHERQITLSRRDGYNRTFLVRVLAEAGEGGLLGFVLTFDDVTELLSAQRKAAWADVARRIAHEIKNPLTPIQLSAERLKRRYLKQIESDREVFEACTDTIVRQVGDIGRMVDEFSSFARMPTPVMARQDLGHLVAQSVELQAGAARQGISFEYEPPDTPVYLQVDSGQIRQALTNLLQNAADSIEARQQIQEQNGETPDPGLVEVRLHCLPEGVEVEIEDNGRGLPAHERERLTEPYMTTREKGTGLGLAIVKKIMEDHGGTLVLSDRHVGKGARVVLQFLRTPGTEEADESDTAADQQEATG
ncbi:sensor histidine kinase NtrY-like [Aquibaculum arenosum]|uniref:Nitrogen regulation protein n=1 Tax=Aquibaculum arenosum TaxID=3032591 RepID=A0ABT5YMU7_9PROT|nr:PAS domain-containing sensor histidine kinase [Fodinicurvata sp. CAU 1616]MDF2096179.1 PAS domain-containing sensor histidine kinase [Fodinicurvata sp. CAU 1616]